MVANDGAAGAGSQNNTQHTQQAQAEQTRAGASLEVPRQAPQQHQIQNQLIQAHHEHELHEAPIALVRPLSELSRSRSRRHSDADLRWEGVTREGRSSSIIRDEGGHVVYPGLVPPPVELFHDSPSPGTAPSGYGDAGTVGTSDAGDASPYGQPKPSTGALSLMPSVNSLGGQAWADALEQQPGAGSSAVELKRLSGAPAVGSSGTPDASDYFGYSGSPGSASTAFAASTAAGTTIAVAAAGTAAYAANPNANQGATGATNAPQAPSRSRMPMKRAETMPTAPRQRKMSEAILIDELRKTATLQWGADVEDAESIASSSDTDDVPRVRRSKAYTRVAGQQQEPERHDAPDRQYPSSHTGLHFWKTRAGTKPQAEDDPRRHHHIAALRRESYRRDGRLPISLKDTTHTGYLAKAVGAAVHRMTTGDSDENDELFSTEDDSTLSVPSEATHVAAAPISAPGHAPVRPSGTKLPAPPARSEAAIAAERITKKLDTKPCPKLNIVIMVIGSRGDVQPFLKIGQVLKEQYGHRVRIATHPAFRDFTEKDAGLEFFSVGGDPAELMAFMVKNPGMIPSLETVKAGDIGRRRSAMAEMFEGFWRACIDATDDPNDIRNLKMVGEKRPFVADAIIANPPSFAHTHCAEALGIPLHLMFTFPYTPTQAFPHPLAVVKQSNVDPGYTNFISYPLVDTMVWQGLGDLVNHFRVNTLGLDPVSKLWAPGASYRMHVPFTYLWSPGLIPKPADWGPEIDIAGFVFLGLASSFSPSSNLEAFLSNKEDPPIYIGFGSIVVDDAAKFTAMIYEAVRLAGVRALVSQGWGGFGGDGTEVPDNVFILGNTPHDWLFPQIRACVIHGGAGTTAIALKCGVPTMVVPFFGDQYFWGSMIEKSKIGPKPVPYKRLTAQRLADGIKYLLTDEARQAAANVAASIRQEGDGAENACRSFHETLKLRGPNSMRCAIFPDRVAVWQRKESHVKLSALAADAIVDRGYLSYKKLRLLRHMEWNDFEGPGEPITAVVGSATTTVVNVLSGIFVEPVRAANKQWKRRGQLMPRSHVRRWRNKTNAKVDDSSSTSSTDATAVNEADGQVVVVARKTHGGDGKDVSFQELFVSVGHGLGSSLVAVAFAPLEMWFALCQGFHNAPRLYGDTTVRRPPRVTGIKSGFKAAGNEFVFGIYDGVTGLVRLPVRGARTGGIRGCVRGVGMGVMGFLLKDFSALIGPVGYVFKGLTKQAERANAPTKYIRRARMVQGQREMMAFDEKTRDRIRQQAAAGWSYVHQLWEAIEDKEPVAAPRSTASMDVSRRDLEEGNNAVDKNNMANGNGDANATDEPEHHIFLPHRHDRHHLLRNLELDAALETSELAQVALSAVRRGESLASVVGRQRRFGRQRCHRVNKPHKPQAQEPAAPTLRGGTGPVAVAGAVGAAGSSTQQQPAARSTAAVPIGVSVTTERYQARKEEAARRSKNNVGEGICTAATPIPGSGIVDIPRVMVPDVGKYNSTEDVEDQEDEEADEAAARDEMVAMKRLQTAPDHIGPKYL